VIFPFEEKFYRDRAVDAIFVGHPLADLAIPKIAREKYAADHQLDPAKTWITLMPGSRMKEVRMNLPTMLEAARKLGSNYEFLLPVAPTLSSGWLQQLIGSGRHMHLVPAALHALSQSRAGIIASGTATVEAAVMGTPFVMVYRVTPLTYALGRPRVKVPYFAMVNLIAGREVVPELVQQDFTAQNVIKKMLEIVPDGLARSSMLKGLAEVKDALRGPDRSRRPAADRAAEIALQLLSE
jgi:lipid-A-disaccharide synthase